MYFPSPHQEREGSEDEQGCGQKNENRGIEDRRTATLLSCRRAGTHDALSYQAA